MTVVSALTTTPIISVWLAQWARLGNLGIANRISFCHDKCPGSSATLATANCLMKRLFCFALVLGALVLMQDEALAQQQVDWSRRLAELRRSFAHSANPILQQTRIDVIRFQLNPDDADLPPILVFEGVGLYGGADPKKIEAALLAELKHFKLPGEPYERRTQIGFLATPVYRLQEKAVQEHRKDPDLNVLFEKATFDAEGQLRLHVLYLHEDKAGKVAHIISKDAATEELLRQLGNKQAPAVVRRDYDWRGVQTALQRDFADDDEKSLQRTRLDDAYLEYTADRKGVHFRVAGVCVHPPGLSGENRDLWTERIKRRAPTVGLTNQRGKTNARTRVDDIVLLPNPSLAWQNALAAEEKHDGIYLHAARFDRLGKLKIRVQLPADTQRVDVLRLMQTKLAPAKLGTLGQDNLETQVWKWQEVLIKGQERLADGEIFLRRSRLDRAFLAYDDVERGEPHLHLEGVSLHPTEALSPKHQRAKLESALMGLLPISLEHKFHLERMHFLVSPIYALQAEAVARGLDGVLFADARYDDCGDLHLSVSLGAPAQRPAVEAILDQAKIPVGAIRPRGAKEQPLRDFMQLTWSSELEWMQNWLARYGETLARKTRIDRAYFSYPDDKKGPNLHIAMVGLYPSKDTSVPVVTEHLDKLIRRTLAQRVGAGPMTVMPVVQVITANPAQLVQDKVSGAPMLDGVRLDDVSFNEKGMLVFHGIWSRKDQEKPLEKLVYDSLTRAHPALTHGIHWGAMQAYDSSELLTRMRSWVARQEDLDEVWLERLHFDGTGKARLVGFYTRADDEKKIKAALLEFLPKFPSQHLPRVAPPGPAAPMPPKGVVPVAFLQQPKVEGPLLLIQLPNILQHLRRSIPKVARCDGLRVDRCSYDKDGVLRIDGLLDHPTQMNELKAFLEDEKAPFDRSRQLAKGWRQGHAVVIPLAPMMLSLRENLPSLAEFDGLTLRRAHHDAANRLQFTAHAVGDPNPEERTKILERLVRTHPRWRLRTSDGVALVVSDQQKPNEELAYRNVTRALHLLQISIGAAHIEPACPMCKPTWGSDRPFDSKRPRVGPTDEDYDRCLEFLDAALLHNSRDVLAWYLRGYCLQAKNRADLTLRDFRRMVALEVETPELRHKRIQDLELVQGVHRQSAYLIELKAIIDVSDGWRLRVLPDPVAHVRSK